MELYNEGVYYKTNRAIIKRDNKLIVRNTWTGEEKALLDDLE